MTFLENIKAIPVTDLAERMGFRLVRKGRYYSLKEHDSVMIDTSKNCFWRNSRFSRGFKGGAGSSIDFYMEFSGEKEYKKAMRQLAIMYGISGDKPPQMAYKKMSVPQKKQEPEKKERIPAGRLWLPPQDKRNNAVFGYLLKRGISNDVIKYFLARKMLYQDEKRNCVFVSPLLDFACIRSTGEQRFMGDCEGCDYDRCFFFKCKGDAKRLIVAESVIEIMSVMTVLQIWGERYTDNAYLATAGTNKIQSLFTHLREQPQIREVWLCNNWDEAGLKADEVAIEGMKEIGFRGLWFLKKPPSEQFNDWNDYVKSLM